MVNVYDITIGFVEAIDIYGEFARQERTGTDMAVKAACKLFRDAGLRLPTRAPTVEERTALLRLASMTENPGRALRRKDNRVNILANSYTSDAFGQDFNLWGDKPLPATLADVPNVAGQAPEIYIGAADAWQDAGYSQGPAEQLPADTAKYWNPPPPNVDPSQPPDPSQPGNAEPGATGGPGFDPAHGPDNAR